VPAFDPASADDHAFDSIYPLPIRRLSARFWTPVGVARRAAELFRRAGARRVLDVGSGAGKFVLAAAAAEPGIDFVGIEQRAHLVDVAQRAKHDLSILNAEFCFGDVAAMLWEGFDAAYLFNPLAENLYARDDRIDDGVVLNEARFRRDVSSVERALRSMNRGATVVTYHGASTRIPGSFDLDSSEPLGTDWLRVWTKNHNHDDGSYWVEEYGGTVERIADGRVLSAAAGIPK
jgi:SAM-dependent methyltransferase